MRQQRVQLAYQRRRAARVQSDNRLFFATYQSALTAHLTTHQWQFDGKRCEKGGDYARAAMALAAFAVNYLNGSAA